MVMGLECNGQATYHFTGRAGEPNCREAGLSHDMHCVRLTPRPREQRRCRRGGQGGACKGLA